MRLALALLLAVPLLAGCLSSTESRSNGGETCFNGQCSGGERKMTCVNGECEVCVDGACADCERDECAQCVDGGECPTVPQSQAPAEPLDDVDIQETHSLAQGLPRTTWTFQVAPGATSHARWVVQDLATRSVAASANLCVEWSITGPGLQSDGSNGSCGTGFAVVSGTTTDRPLHVVDWDRLTAGTYTVTASGPPQVNELVVDVVVDNP